MGDDKTTAKPNDSASAPAEVAAKEKPEHEKANPFESALRRYLTKIDSLASTLPLALSAIQAAQKTSAETLRKFMDENTEKITRDGVEYLTIKSDHWLRFNKLTGRREKFAIASETVPSSFLVSLVSQFDAFVGDLIEVLFEAKPETLNASEKPLTFGELLEFGSIEEARRFIIEKEIESVLRKSHTEQFDWLEKRFGLPLRRGLASWSEFIEITERRNLLVHTDGAISNQYLVVCKTHGVALDPSAKVGHKLRVPHKYFERAYFVMFEIGAKLAHVLWRKLLPEVRVVADSNLSNVCYELLEDERYDLARELLDFATCVLKEHSSDEVRRRLIVNRAQAYKWLGEQSKAAEIMSAEDWSASSDMFRLAEAVIRDDFVTAARFMERVGTSTEKAFYRDWPLFKEFRKSEQFAKTYENVWGVPFNVVVDASATLPSEEPRDSEEA
jgi:hypothetical protein